MRQELITLSQQGSIQALFIFIQKYHQSDEFQQLLNQEELFLEIYFEYYAPNLEQPHHANIFMCLQLLVAYGLKKPQRLDNNKLLCFETQRNRLLNNYRRQLDREYCVQLQGFRCNSSQELNCFLAYLRRQPNLQADLANSTIIQELEEYQAYLLLLEQHRQNKTLLSFFERTISDDKALAPRTDIHATVSQLYPALSECACHGHEREVRQQLEAELLSQALKRYPPQSTVSLNYLSIGSGKLLQDFIIVLKLLKVGYKNIQISLIEPNLSLLAQNQFNWLALIAQELKAKITINYFNSVAQYQVNAQPQKAHLIVGIDFENIFKANVFNDVMQTQDLLAGDGFFLFSYDQYKMAVTTDSVKPFLMTKEQTLFQDIFKDLPDRLPPDKSTITMAIVGQGQLMDQWLYALPLLQKTAAREFTLYLAPPANHSYFSKPLVNTRNEGFTEENIAKFLSLCLNKDVVVKFAEEKKIISELSQTIDIVTTFDRVAKNLEELYQDIEVLKTKFNRSLCYINATFVDENNISLVIANGNETTWLPKEQAIARSKQMKEAFDDIKTLLIHCSELIKALPSTGQPNFFTEDSEQVRRIKKAISRAKNTFMYSLSSLNHSDSKSYVTEFLMKSFDDDESVYEAFSQKDLQTNAQQSLLDFIKNSFAIELNMAGSLVSNCQ
ncbi:hypothetical protein [Legionella sp. 16cNR16C]|uniref:hypothetical protein n=1 Tax=Legionella sp. 16cNR16C TaxID=2905656 RepID=UPI001E5EA82F|nr:hypothetical protein [Legionella sp. 16cNR16C]MCE3043884.1 hypothetical protein [Legionella sp. 16cNR16C]